MISKIDRQFGGFAIGVGLPFVTALIVTPLIARNLSSTTLMIAGASLVAHAMFGLFDIFRPILIRQFVNVEGKVALAPLLARPIAVALPLGVLMSVGIRKGLPELGNEFAIAAGASLVIFLLGTPFWARLDADRRTGHAYALRASGIIALYILFALTGPVLPQTHAPWYILTANMAIAGAYIFTARRYFASVGQKVTMPAREMAYVLGQNLLKSFGDYADRIAIVGTGNAALAGQYNLLADLPLKTNTPSQIAASYTYPRLCENDGCLKRFVLFGVLVSLAVSSTALLLYLAGRPLYILYYGDRFADLFPLFCMLLSVAATYALSFYGQAYLRAKSHDAQLLISFGLPGLAGAVYLLAGPLDLVRVLTALVIFRSCSLLMSLFALRSGGRIFLAFLPVYGYALAISLYLLGRIAS